MSRSTRARLGGRKAPSFAAPSAESLAAISAAASSLTASASAHGTFATSANSISAASIQQSADESRLVDALLCLSHESTPSSQSVTVPRSSAPFPLYDDVLQCVLPFLTLRELHQACQWANRVYKLIQAMRPLCQVVESQDETNRSLKSFISLDFDLNVVTVNSAVGRHVGELRLHHRTLDQTEWLSIVEQFPNLTRLPHHYFTLAWDEFEPYEFVLPKLLKRFNSSVTGEFLPYLIPSLMRLTDLEVLDLSMTSSCPQVDFSPLQGLGKLNDLKLLFAPTPTEYRDSIAQSEQERFIHPSVFALIRATPTLRKLVFLVKALNPDREKLDDLELPWLTTIMRDQISCATLMLTHQIVYRYRCQYTLTGVGFAKPKWLTGEETLL